MLFIKMAMKDTKSNVKVNKKMSASYNFNKGISEGPHCGSVQHSSTSVSYTHLDVYKRQTR